MCGTAPDSPLLREIFVRCDNQSADEVLDEWNVRLDHDDRCRAEHHLRQPLDWLVGSCLRIEVLQNHASVALANCFLEQRSDCGFRHFLVASLSPEWGHRRCD